MSGPEQEIRRRIATEGRITFEEFMRLALYHPDGGYYSSSDPFGESGDFYTAPSTHPAFGACMANHLLRMWELLNQPNPFYAVELGAGAGILTRDASIYAANFPAAFQNAVRYLTLDRYPLVGGLNVGQRVLTETVPLRGITGCIFSNELPDAFPMHRFRMEKSRIREIYVSANDDGKLVEVTGEPSTSELERRLSSLNWGWPNGYEGEVNLRIKPWITSLASALNRGFVISIDYGYLAEELYSPTRTWGTLQTYYKHVDGSSPYQRIGRQDLTAHVDFSLLMEEGESAGLSTLNFGTQGAYLQSLGLDSMMEGVRGQSLPLWERTANLRAMRELADSEGFGNFKVLVQSKGLSGVSAKDIFPHNLGTTVLPPPLKADHHMSTTESTHPQTSFTLDSLWQEEGNDPI
jgi:SAM-dependent MidA family methyltransferase